jgi:heme/copper-type cytochrome/quinol oxidase subunit 2
MRDANIGSGVTSVRGQQQVHSLSATSKASRRREGRTGRVWLVTALIAFVAAVLGVGITLAIVGFKATDRGIPEPVEPQPPVEPLRVAAPATVVDAAPITPTLEVSSSLPPISEPVEIAITLTDVPEGADFFVNDEPARGPVLHVPRGEPVHIRVELAGYRPWRGMISTETDSMHAVTLEAEEQRERRERRTGGDRPRPNGTGPLKRNPFEF